MSVNSVTGLDHVIVLADDLDAASVRFERLGFTLTPVGLHKHGTSRNRTIVFADTYIELLYVAPEARAASRFEDDLFGFAAIGLATPDSDRVHAELETLGHAVAPVGGGGRPVELAGHGVYDARFRTQRFPETAPPLPSLFTCQHLTRDLVYRAEARGHANGALDVTTAHLVHSAPAELAAIYAGLFGREAVVETPARVDVALGRFTIRIHTPDAAAAAFPGLSAPAGGPGWFAGLTIAVRSVHALRGVLPRDLRSRQLSDGSLLVPPSEVGGGFILFQTA